MQLFHNPASPFCRKIDILLNETGHVGDVEPLSASGHPTAAGSDANMPLAHNPLGKIPTLLRPDGPALYDSRVICRYLDDLYDAGFYPANRLWEVLTLEATADGVMDAAVLMVYEKRSRPAERQDPAWVEAQWAKILRTLDAVEARWMSHLAGRRAGLSRLPPCRPRLARGPQHAGGLVRQVRGASIDDRHLARTTVGRTHCGEGEAVFAAFGAKCSSSEGETRNPARVCPLDV